ncbi:hypothetical protein [Nocardioides terrisoli]|uniref:hypothetical protein n=1 Tax=Nocardioides terrisoli TaxID=3388267 RepID=UPI00287B69F0|nr:hypothetical protein [Nocardioides marmorisolisilvae]
MKRPPLLATAVVAVVTSLGVLSGCSLPGTTPVGSAGATHKVVDPERAFPSEFTADGTFQSHINIGNVDFVYTLWPTKATPRTHEWFARGRKHFSLSLTAYDLDRGLRDKFATKRMVYLQDISVTSSTRRPHGRSQSPYHLDTQAWRVTFDPEPVRTVHGMLITSPKGAFDLRNQTIHPVAVGTVGMVLTFRATVMIERSPGSAAYTRRVVRQRVPITIFPGKQRTRSAPIPIDAN